MAKLASSGIKKKDGKRPLDDCMDAVLRHRDFNQALQPLPGRSQAEAVPPPGKRVLPEEPGEALTRSQRKKRARAAAAAKAAASSSAPPPAVRPADGPKKGEGKGKGKLDGPRVPAQLRVEGASSVDTHGNPICFAFNLGGCPNAPPGGSCPRGRHICVLKKSFSRVSCAPAPSPAHSRERDGSSAGKIAREFPACQPSGRPKAGTRLENAR